MKIEVIEAPRKESAIEAWNISRPGANETEYANICGIDAYINDIPSFVLHIEAPIIIREIFASMIGHAMWAATSRVTDPVNFEIDESMYVHADEYEGVRELMISNKEHYVPQDIYRLNMPVAAKTNFVCRISVRQLVKMKKYFRDLCLEDNHFYSAFFEMRNNINEVLLNSFSINEISQMQKYKSANFVNSVSDDFVDGQTGTKNGHTTFAITAPFSLRSHIARHNIIQMNDDLVKACHSPVFLNTQIRMQLAASTSAWMDIYSKRSCWMAHYGLWKPLLNMIENELAPEEGSLPCRGDGCQCPYSADAEKRFTEADPGAPCPVYARSNKIALTKQDKDSILNQMQYDNRPNFWRNYL